MTSTPPLPAGAARRRGAFVLIGILLGLVLPVLGAGAASAHATLDSSAPADGQVLTGQPAAVVLTFDEPVELALGWIRVYAADGSEVQSGAATHPAGAAAKASAPLRPGLDQGSYLVDWRVASVDSHPISGSFTFSVGAPGAVASISRTAPSDSVRLLLGLCRFLAFAGVAVLIGTVAVLLLCWPAGWVSPSAVGMIWGALTGTSLASLAALLLQGAQWSGRGLDGVLDPTVWSTLPDTRLGLATGLRVLVLLAIAAVLRLGVAEHIGPPARAVRLLLAGAMAGLLVTVAIAGHAAAGAMTWLTVPLDVAHLAAFSTWLGGLPLLAGVLLRAGQPQQVTDAVARFSRIAMACVGILVLTGTLQAWRQIGTPGAVFGSVYGRLIVVKLLLLATVVALALLSRQWVRRRLEAAPGRRGAGAEVAAPAAVLQRTVGAELTLGVVVVAVTAVLVAVPPGRVSYLPTQTRTVTAGPVTVKLRAVPEGTRQVALHVYTYDQQDRPVTLPEVRTRARLPGRDVGPLTVELSPVSTGHLVADRVRLPLAGDWDVQVYLRTTEVDSFSASTELTVR